MLESRVERAEALFKEGYNCSQAVFLAYADLVGLDFETALKVSCGFGGGMGRMREICGAVSAMALFSGFFENMKDGADAEGKKRNYELVRKLVHRFEKQHGSYICRDLLGLLAKEKESATPEERTDEYYRKRPCIRHIASAARILEEELFTEENGY